MSNRVSQLFSNPDSKWGVTRECTPQVIKCEPRNAWESFISDFSYQSVNAFSEGMAVVVTVLLLAAVAVAATRIFRNSRNYSAIYAMAMSGVASCALAFGLMRYPRHEPYLIGIGTSLIVGAVFAAISAVKDAGRSQKP